MSFIDTGSRFTASRVKTFLEELGVEMLFVGQSSPWENGHVELFHSRMRDALLDGESLLPIDEMKYVAKCW